MPPRGVEKGSKRARQYEHIKDGLEKRGESEDVAEEIAARTVNKERARHGESRDLIEALEGRHLVRSPGRSPLARRPRPRAHEGAAVRRGSPQGVEGRSKMNKAQLERAVGR